MAAPLLRSFEIMKAVVHRAFLADNFITNSRLRSTATSCLWRWRHNITSCDQAARPQSLSGRRAWIITNKRFSLCSSVCSAHAVKGGSVQRLLRYMGKLDYSRSKLEFAGLVLYTKCTDDVDYVDFMRKCEMVDTFLSWFLLTELHVWMCMVRLSVEGDEGKAVRHSLITSLWKDTTARAKLVATMNASKRKKELHELNEQLLAAVYLYDEGLLSDDKVLAGALWRHMLQRKCENPAILESLVHYVRKQTLHLEQYSREDMLIRGDIKWLPLTDPNVYERL